MSLFSIFKDKLSKTSNILSFNILEILKNKKIDDLTLEELENVLISSDISLDVVNHLIDSIKKIKISNDDGIKNVLEILAQNISIQPHIDPAIYATVLYLNEEGEGGTSFFTHSATGLTNTENIYKPFKRTQEYWNLKEWIYDFSNKATDLIDNDTTLIEEVWEEQHHVQMKFNRMIIYPSFMWHSAIMKNGWYKDDPRISLSGFVFAPSLNVDVNAE